ncbi:MAG: type II toxin-antitoxin system VapC family toxin [Candidatus Sulfotelmatobacter sp.]
MKVLLDTHALVWWLEDAKRLSRRAKSILSSLDNSILISAAVGWEIAIKVNTGKMNPPSILDGFTDKLERLGFSALPITLEMAIRAGLLPPYHRDPFDRMLVAQAQSLNIPILSADALLDQYHVKRLW